MSAHSYIYVTIFYFLNYLFFKKKFFFFFLKMMLTYHISHEKFFSTALYVHGRSGVNNQYLTVLLCWGGGDLPRNRAKGVNPGGDGVDVSPPCFDMGG